MVSPGDAVCLLLVYSYVAAVVLLARFLDSRGFDNCKRKTVHVLTGNIVFMWWIFDSQYVMALLAAAPFIPILYLASPACRAERFKKTFLGYASEEGHDLGLVYYAVSWTVLAFFLFDYRAAASVGIVAMAYGDGLGGLIGERFGRRRLGNGKTLEGTLSVFMGAAAVTTIVMLFYQWLNAQGVYGSTAIGIPYIAGIALLVGAYVALVELYTPGRYDNLIIPISSALILVALGV